MKHRILFVEDDVMVSSVVKDMLCHAGYEVVVTRDLADTMKLGSFAFDAVISDLILLNSDGCEVINFIRRKKPGIPAMLISGYGERVADTAASRGITHVSFLSKPFTASSLLDSVAKLTGIIEPRIMTRG